MKLSIIIPIYNEKDTILKILKMVNDVKLINNIQKEIIIIDDFSTDGSRKILNSLENKYKILYYQENRGKGAALKTGFDKATGDYVIVQDADLEYDPDDYNKLLDPIIKNKTKVVYGSRFTGEHRNMLFWHWIGNKSLSLITNVLYNTTLSDMETCYKLIKKDILNQINIKSNRFNFEPEITAKILKLGYKIYEVPISYMGRGYNEGKKIGWKDGIIALYCLIKYRFWN